MFRINNLTCSYRAGHSVLKIPELTIPFQEVVFIIGLSGSGKSTLLETLGLMNNTLDPGSSVEFTAGDSGSYEYFSLWNGGDAKARSDVRRRYFSFVFQQNNLMNNFTALENICLGQMIQGVSFRESMVKTRKYLAELNLSEIGTDRLCQELSGGEKQRIAFVRALSTDSMVVFGDEPTGNLDSRNADDLFTVLRETVKRHGRTAIIVSHDLEMARKHADRIIALEKDGDSFRVGRNSTFVRQPDGFRNDEGTGLDFNRLFGKDSHVVS